MWRYLARPAVLAVAALLLTFSACRVTDMAIWSPTDRLGAEPCAVTVIRDIVYRPGPEKDEYRRRLDLYLPAGQHDFPVVVLVHGGCWLLGDNRCCGLYSSVGQFLASAGIGAVLPNYRLSPGVKHPAHVQDVAKAVAWTKQHIGEYGGRSDPLFLVGHSAGGHLVALLATDDRYLKAEGLTSADIAGVVAISGVYHLPPGCVHGALGGCSPTAFHWDQVMPVRDTSPLPRRAHWSGLPLDINVYGLAFGDDRSVRADASPIEHVHPGLPPFLLINAGNDLPTLPDMATEFHDALAAAGCDAQCLRVARRNHSSVMFHAVSANDPVAQAIVGFVHRQAQKVEVTR